MRRGRDLVTCSVAAVLAGLLSGCVPVGGAAKPADTGPPPDESATAAPSDEAAAPSGWSEFDACPSGSGIPWQWVDGFPAAAMDAAGARIMCGETAVGGAKREVYEYVFAVMTTDQIDGLGRDLEADGYELLVDDFPAADKAAEYAGARDYYLGGDSAAGFTRVALEIYEPPAGVSSGDGWAVYVDFVSPATRALDLG